MDRRTLLALLLTEAVIVMTPILFPAPPRRPVDTTALAATDSAAAPSQLPPPVAAPTQTLTQGPTPPTQARAAVMTQPAVRVDTTTVTTQHAVYRFSSLGATPIQ